MRTRLFALPFSQVAFVSRVFASPGRMSYLSKSKYTSFRLAFSENSLGRGGVAGAAVAGPAVEGVAGAGVALLGPDGAAIEGLGAPGAAGAIAEPLGAGADAAVVAGRFGHPVTSSIKARRGSRRCS
jgi:hypothetical protein